MRIKRKDEFGDIGTVVFYNFKCFIPDPEYVVDPSLMPSDEERAILQDFLDGSRINNVEFRTTISGLVTYKEIASTKKLIHGGTKHFDNIDFAEYDFNVVLEDHKFNSKDIISYLDEESRAKIGTNLGSLEKINSVLFPTISSSEREIDVEYFNTLGLSAVTLYLFNADPGVYKIELYEDVIDSNNPEGDFIESDALRILHGSEEDFEDKYIMPAVTIYLGPNQECINNPMSMYDTDDPLIYPYPNLRENISYSYSPEDYSKLYDEIYSGKAVWLVLSAENSIREVNLSYNAWLLSEDANIFKHKFNLRNDDYYDKTRSEYLESDNFDYTDLRSGKLLGTSIIAPNLVTPTSSSCPILSKKLKRIKEQTEQDTKTYGDLEVKAYNPEIEYSPGDLVHFNNQVYKVLKKNNRCHFPNTSSYWALNDSIKNISTTRITIVNYTREKVTTNPVTYRYEADMSAGISWPNKQITLSDNLELSDMNFEVNPSLGYSFVDVCFQNSNSDVIEPLVVDSDYTVREVVEEDDYFSLVTIKPDGWAKILGPNSWERIVFVFEKKNSIVKMKSSLGTVQIIGIDTAPISPTLESLLSPGNNGGGYIGQVPIPTPGTGTGSSGSGVPYAEEPDLYCVALSTIEVNGRSYTTTTNIRDQLTSLNVGKNVKLKFALIDYENNATSKYISASLSKLAKGTITNEEIPVSTSVSYVNKQWVNGKSVINTPILTVDLKDIDFESVNIDIVAENKVNVAVTDYKGFEVDKDDFLVTYGDNTEIKFYGTYGDNFNSVEIYYGAGLPKILTDPTAGMVELSGGMKVYLVKNGTMYTLGFTAVNHDLIIKLKDKNDIE